MPRLCNKQAASIVIWMKRRSAMIMFMTAAAPDAGAAAALDGCIARIAQGSQEALHSSMTAPGLRFTDLPYPYSKAPMTLRMCCTTPIYRCGTPQGITAPRESPWPG